MSNKVKIIVAYTKRKTSQLFRNKDVIPNEIKSNVLYRYNCGQCDCCYIGKTFRHFDTRTGEHIKGQPTPTEVTLHDHNPTYEDFSIIGRANNDMHLLIKESILLKEFPRKDLLLNDKSLPLYVFMT